MYRLNHTTKFKKDIKLCKRRGYKMNILYSVLEQLMENGYVNDSFGPHTLVSNYANHWECHLNPDWLLIWKKTDFDFTLSEEDNHNFNTDFEIYLVRTGTHSDLFNK